MENKYKLFEESIENLKNEEVKKECRSMTALALRYYTYYYQFKKLKSVNRRLANIYPLKSKLKKSKNGRIIPKKGELEIEYRLFLEFYCKLIEKEYPAYSKKDVGDCILGQFYKEDIEEYEEVFGKFKIGRDDLWEWVERSCIKAQKCGYKKEKMSLGMDNIREAMQIYGQYRDISGLTEITEEKSFNEVYSEKYIIVLTDVMKKNEGILRLFLAPVRAQLCFEEEGGREINSKAWKWCFNKDFRFSLSQLKDEIQLMKNYEMIYKNYTVISKKIKKIEEQIFTMKVHKQEISHSNILEDKSYEENV